MKLSNKSYLIFAVAVFITMLLSPLMGDDYFWILVQPKRGFEFSRLWQMSVAHYQTVVGRYTANLILGVLCLLPQWLYACVNTIAFCGLTVALCCLFRIGRDRRFLFLCLMSIFAIQHEATCWRSGSGNYLWPAFLVSMSTCAFLAAPFRSFAARLLQNIGSVALAFVAAGGHELLDCSLAVILVVYWARRLLQERRIPFDRQMCMTLAFAVGAFLVIAAPGSLNRAAGTGVFALNDGLVWYVASKCRAALRCFCTCPVILLDIFLLCLCCLRNRRALTDSRVLFPSIFLLVLLGVTCLLSDGVGRTGGLVSVGALAVLFPLLDVLNLSIRRGVVAVCGVIASFVVLLTIIQSARARISYSAMIDGWLNDPRGILRRTDWRLPAPLDWIDNALRVNNIIKIGSAYPNTLIARYHGCHHLIALTDAMASSLSGENGLFSPARFHPRPPSGFFSVVGVDMIAVRYEGRQEVGRPITGQTRFYHTPQLSTVRRILDRVVRPGSTDICPESTVESMVQDRVLDGFIYVDGGERYAVFVLNRTVPRDAIKQVDVIEPTPKKETSISALLN